VGAPKGTVSMAVSGLSFRNTLVGSLLSSYARTAWENSPLTLHGTHFRRGSFFPVWLSGCRLRAVTIASSLMGGCGLSHKCVEDGCKSTCQSCVKFGHWKPHKTGDIVRLMHVQCIT